MITRLKKQERLLAWLVALGLVLAAVASTMFYTRLDLTSSRAFTLSRAARSLHEEIPESVRISYFVSKSLADRHPGPGAIEDLLREIEAASKGKIRVRIVDPTKDPAEAEKFGVAAQQMQVVERSEQRVAMVYTGIVMEYLDRHETIPAVLATETLEYELVKSIRAVVGDIHLVAGLLAGDEDKLVANDYQTLSGSLARAGYEPREVLRGKVLEDDIDLLFVLGNASIDRYDAAFIDAFLMRGGKAFFAVKGVSINPEYGLVAAPVSEGGLLPMLATYGFDVQRRLVLDQSNLTVPFQTQRQGGGYQIQYVRYPHWVAIDSRFVNPDSPMTARFAGLDLYWPSPMTLKSVAGVTYEELAKTTPKAWLQTQDFAAAPEDQSRYAQELAETMGQYLVAASATGSFPSAFATGDTPFRDGAPPPPEPVAITSSPTRIVVVSSADFLTDLMKMSDSGFNASFALSAADWLSSRDDLIEIRSRAVTDTRLNKIQEQGLREFLMVLTYIVTLGLVPLGVVAWGFLRFAKRNRAERESRVQRGGEA
jgi:ABC-type uncharacterized transport system involved in gliding motility auxiliary subunit